VNLFCESSDVCRDACGSAGPSGPEGTERLYQEFQMS